MYTFILLAIWECIKWIHAWSYDRYHSTYHRFLGLQEKLATLNHVVLMADFAMAMKQKLQDINLHSFNNFQMKVGKSDGMPF